MFSVDSWNTTNYVCAINSGTILRIYSNDTSFDKTLIVALLVDAIVLALF